MSNALEDLYTSFCADYSAWEKRATQAWAAYAKAHNAMLDELKKTYDSTPTERVPAHCDFSNFESSDIAFSHWYQGDSEDTTFYMPASYLWDPEGAINSQREQLVSQLELEKRRRDLLIEENARVAEESQRRLLRELAKKFPDEILKGLSVDEPKPNRVDLVHRPSKPVG